MNKLPDEIADRCVITIKDSLEIITEIAPLGPCEDCGRELDQERRVEMRQIEYPYRHWRYRCVACKQVRNPVTGAYDCDVKTANALDRQIFSEKNRKD